MDNHPIPQDITGFQFKIIGKMTIKQFIYLGVGVGIAWLFIWIIPVSIFIKWPVAIVSAGLGILFAFIPISGRPADVMLGNFLNALTSPTRYSYKKEGASLAGGNIQKSQPGQSPTIHLPGPKVQKNNPPYYATYKAQPATAQAPATDPSAPIAIKADEEKKKIEEDKLKKEEVVLEKKEEEIEEKIENTQAAQAQPSPIQQNTKELEQVLAQTTKQKEELEKQLLILQGKMSNQQKAYSPSVAKPLEQTKNVRKVPKEMKKEVGVGNIPENPNIITGIIKDSRGNPLPNILVEVNDLDGNPVRAFKTNGLGQFASATPVVNGKYHIGFEDSKKDHKFDAVEIEATGEVLMPLEIISIDKREELRRELFN